MRERHPGLLHIEGSIAVVATFYLQKAWMPFIKAHTFKSLRQADMRAFCGEGGGGYVHQSSAPVSTKPVKSATSVSTACVTPTALWRAGKTILEFLGRSFSIRTAFKTGAVRLPHRASCVYPLTVGL